MSKPENPQAFPMLGNVGYNSDWQIGDGMDLLDWFAGKAMIAAHSRAAGSRFDLKPRDEDFAEDAKLFYRMATAMLTERQRIKEESDG